MIFMEKQIEQLNKRIEFLEALLEVNSKTLSKSLETNRILLNYLTTNYQQR